MHTHPDFFLGKGGSTLLGAAFCTFYGQKIYNLRRMKISSFFVNNIKYFFVILHRKTCGWHIANPVWGAGLQPSSGYFEEFVEEPEFYSPDADSFCEDVYSETTVGNGGL